MTFLDLSFIVRCEQRMQTCGYLHWWMMFRDDTSGITCLPRSLSPGKFVADRRRANDSKR